MNLFDVFQPRFITFPDKTRMIGHCECQAGYSGADCSALTQEPPYSSEIRNRGLCDIRYMKCDRVIVYGENFINGPNLTCHLQRCQVIICSDSSN